MAKKRKANQLKNDGKRDILFIYKAILESVHQKATNTITEHFGQDNRSVAEKKWFEVADQLREDAPWRIRNAVSFLCCMDNFSGCLKDGEEALGNAIIHAFELGHTSAYVELEADIPVGAEGAIESYRKGLEGSSKGGKAGKILDTPEKKELALKLIEEHQAGSVSKTAACIRAASDLLKLHNIEISAKVLTRL